MRDRSEVSKKEPGRLLLLAASLALGAGACLGDGLDDEPEVGAGVQKIEELEDECTAGRVSWANPTDETQACAGPWTYQQYPTVTDRNPMCGAPVGCTQFNLCTHWETQPTVHPSTDYTLPTEGCGFVVDVGLVCRPDWNQANDICANFESQMVGNFDAPADQQVTSSSSFTSLLTAENARNHTFRCDVEIHYNKAFTDRNPVCGCEVHLYPECQHAVVGGGTSVRVLTAAGKTKAQVRVDHNDAPVGQVPDAAIAPICSTGEDEPSLLAKLSRLLANLQDATIAVPGSAVKDELIRRAKLSYELLDNGQVANGAAPHAALLDLYQQNPTVEPACGRHKPTTQQQCGGDWQLRLCTRLTSAHVKVEPGRGDLVRRLYPNCLDQLSALGDDIEDSADATCTAGGDYAAASVDAQRRLQDKLLLRFGMLLNPDPSANNNSTIADALHLIDLWYVQAARVLDGEAPLRAELDLVANKFWQVAYGYKPGTEETEWIGNSAYSELQAKLDLAENQTPAVARQTIESALSDTETRGLRLDRQVITAAYSDLGTDPVIVGVPLLRITSDALEPLTGRLEALVNFHDIGCALADCVAFTTPTKLSRFWKVLAHLDAGPGSGPGTLTSILAATPGDMLGWKSAFDAIKAKQGRLIDAMAGTSAESLAGTQLRSSIEHAQTRAGSYAATGLFLPPVGNRLHTGVHANQRARVKEELIDLNGRMAAVQTSIDNRLVQLVDGLVRVREGQTAQAQLEATRDRLQIEIDDLRERDGAFRSVIASGSAQSQESAFEELMEAWAAVQGAVDQEDTLRLGDTTELFLTAEHANFDGWHGGTNIGTVGVQKIEVPAKQTISISTENVWAPSCALRDARMIDPDTLLPGDPGVEGQHIDPTGVFVGPEGYSISWTGSGFAASSVHAGVDFRLTAGVRGEACAASPTFATGNGARACAYIDASVTLEQGHNWQRGDEERSSSQFSSGIFLPTTPFDAPAGALVVVEMPPGETDRHQIRDVHLVRGPHTTIVVDEPADLWFAVNDINCDQQDTSQVLRVKVATFVAFGDIAESLLKRMAHATTLIRDRLPGLLERGEILPSESTEIQLDAKLDVIEGPGEPQIAVDDYPAPLRDLFYKFVAREMTRLEAAIRVKNIERELAIKSGEFSAASVAIQNNSMSGYLLSLVPKWTVRGLRFKELRSISEDYAQDIHSFVGPMLKIWYPGVLDDLDEVSALDSLTQVDIDTPVLDMTGWLNELGNQLAQRIDTAEVPYPLPQDTAPAFVSLRFPKPSQLDPTCANIPSARCPAIGQTSTFRWATVAQTKKLWDAIGLATDGRTSRRLEFQPTPDDLYQLLSGTHYLSCTKSLPVVRKIALAPTGYTVGQLPTEQRELEGRIPDASPMAFADSTGLHVFELANPTWLHLANVPVIYAAGDYNKVRNDLGTLPQDVRGVSPFTTFQFDLTEATVAEWNLRNARTLDLVLELEAIRSNDLVAVPICTPAQ